MRWNTINLVPNLGLFEHSFSRNPFSESPHFQLSTRLQERRQGKWVAAILDAKNAQEKAVENKADTGTTKDRDLLHSGAVDTGQFVGKENRSEGKCTV